MDLPDIRFGVASHSDYPYYYSYCGYSDTYGRSGSGDFPYNLDRPLTYYTALVRPTINSLYIRYRGTVPRITRGYFGRC